MLSFLLWMSTSGNSHQEPTPVARAFGDLFAPYLPPETQIHTRTISQTHLVWFELPVHGWRPPFFQEDAQTAVWAANFPLNAPEILESRGITADPAGMLPPLARALQNHPRHIVEQLVPPMLLLWEDKPTGQLHMLNDALGHAQFYRYCGDGTIAFSNRLFAFKALSVPLTPSAAEWAANCSFGWFPLNRTGFNEVRFVEPSTYYIGSGSGTFREQSLSALDSWIKPPPASDQACLEMARKALVGYIRATWPLFSDASGGLTGGFDSRAIFATYRFLGLHLRPRVKGPANNYDVILSKKLAAIAGLDLTVKPKAEQPPVSPESIRDSVFAALVWQAGNMDNEKLIRFLADNGRMPGGSVTASSGAGFSPV